jgi:hypothetical protein
VIDGIALARIDPSQHRFSVLDESSGKKHLEDWMRETDAELIVNASYYDREGKPATPVVSTTRKQASYLILFFSPRMVLSGPCRVSGLQTGRLLASIIKGAPLSAPPSRLFFSGSVGQLKTAIPDLKAALNLDGGPVASQAIAVGDVRRKVHGRWELQGQNGKGRLLPIATFMTAPMPVVIAVFKRT